MTLEQKAKAYEDAIERAKEELGSGCFNKGSIEYIFPELKESAGEKIRKALIDYFEGWQTRAIDENAAYYKDIAIKDILAWLEKLKDFDKQLDEAYQTANAVVYKKGYDDGYLEGIANAKKELEKQGEMDIEMDIEKPITIGRRQLTGKAKELYDNLDAESLAETKKKMLAETSKWTDEDEKICQKYIEMLGKIDAVEYESYSKIVDWIDSLRLRLS